MKSEVKATYESGLSYIDEMIAKARKTIAAEQDTAVAIRDKPMLLGLFMLARATRALRSVRLLFVAGEEDDAISVMRTLAELLIDYAYIVAEDADENERTHRATLYDEWAHVSNWNRLGQFQEHYPDFVRHVDAQMIADLKREYDRIEGNYSRDEEWCKHSRAERAKQGGTTQVYQMGFRFGCDSSHSSPNTLQNVVDATIGRLSVEPVQPDSDFVLYLAALWHHWLLAIVMHEFKVPKAPDDTQIMSELAAAFGRVGETR